MDKALPEALGAARSQPGGMRWLAARVRHRPEWICVPLTLVIAIGGWEWYVKAYQVSAVILPPPSQIVSALYSGLASGLYLKALGVTLQAIVLGFLVFGELPDGIAFAGIALIIASGMYTIHREQVRQRAARAGSEGER